LSSLENLQISKDKKVVKDICFSTFLCFWFFSPDFFTNTGHTKNENVFVKKSCEISLIKESFFEEPFVSLCLKKGKFQRKIKGSFSSLEKNLN
jgi:hypothetical protein